MIEYLGYGNYRYLWVGLDDRRILFPGKQFQKCQGSGTQTIKLQWDLYAKLQRINMFAQLESYFWIPLSNILFSWQLQSFLNVEIKYSDHLIIINLLLISEEVLQAECNLNILKLFPWNTPSLHSLKYPVESAFIK